MKECFILVFCKFKVLLLISGGLFLNFHVSRKCMLKLSHFNLFDGCINMESYCMYNFACRLIFHAFVVVC